MRLVTTSFVLLLTLTAANGEAIGSVSTVFKLLGPNDRIVIEAFDDPKIDGITCHLSRAKKGGVSGAVGLPPIVLTVPSHAARSDRSTIRTRSRTANRFSKNELQFCLKRCKLSVSSTKNETCSFTSSIATN